MIPVDEMDLGAIQAELREPSAAVQSEEHRARRQALWRRLDLLARSGAGIRAEKA
jgi:hypothetical protein